MQPLLPTLSGHFDDQQDALRIADETISWERLSERSRGIAGDIVGQQAVVIEATSSLDTIVGTTAALAAGVPVAPIPSDAGPVERAHIIGDSGATAVVGTPDWADCDLPRIPLGTRPGSAPTLPEPTPETAALIVYTSGTTGMPKGAVISRRALAADLDGLADAWDWTPDDHLVHGLPLFHVHGLVLGVLGPLRVGARLTHTGRFSPAAYAEAATAGATMYFGVPTVWTRMCAEPEAARALRSARLLVSGSAPLPVPVFEQLMEFTGKAPVERYGMTETLITLSTRADGERRPGWVGLPIRGVETRMVADDGAVVEPDGTTIGHLQVRGDTLFDGYLNGGKPSDFDDGWFVTGDSVVIDPGGFHRIVGRTSIDIIKSAGYKVGAGEVETVLLGHPGVREAAVVGVPDNDLGQRVVAFVVADDTSPDAITAFAAELLTTHKRPREVRLVDELPRNAMGKVQKSRLLD